MNCEMHDCGCMATSQGFLKCNYHNAVERAADLAMVHREDCFITKDSGQRQEFETGMVRDTSTDKIRYDLVYMPMFKRWAKLMTRGAKKYTARNWEKAETQEELDRFKESAFRHFMTWFLDEDSSEDHAAAVFFNISGAEFVKEKLNGK